MDEELRLIMDELDRRFEQMQMRIDSLETIVFDIRADLNLLESEIGDED